MIKLIDDYVIKVDSNNYILCIDKHKLNKKGERVYENISYHSTLNGAIYACRNDIIKNQLATVDIMSLNQALNVIAKYNEEFENLLNKAIGD